MKEDIRVRALGNQVTVYDKDGNIIEQIPPPPTVPPKVRYVDIIEIEDRIMGINSRETPDFFIDFENDERFMDVEKSPEFSEPVRFFTRRSVAELVGLSVLCIAAMALGYAIV